MEEQRKLEIQRQIEFEREQKVLRDQQEKQRAEEDAKRLEKIKKAQEEADRLRKEQRLIEEQERVRILKIKQEEEEETIRLQKIAIEESEQLLQKLREIEENEFTRRKTKQLEKLNAETEAEKQRNFRMIELEAERMKETRFKGAKTTLTYKVDYGGDQLPNYALEDELENANGNYEEDMNQTTQEMLDIGITEEELDEQCNELFKEAPIEFKPRKNNQMDQMIAQIIKLQNITIPIVHIKDTLYLIGSQKVTLVIKRDSLLVQKGGGTEKLENYLAINNRSFQHNLVIYMIKTNESLEYVVDSLINNQRTRLGGRSRVQTTPSSRPGRKSPSPGERKYMQQKDQIMSQMQQVMQKSMMNASRQLDDDEDSEVNHLM